MKTVSIYDSGLAFAQQHDWFVDAKNITGSAKYPARYEVTVQDPSSDELITFQCINELREWAGY